MKEQAFEIEELVLKFLRGELSIEEQNALDAWRNESAKNQLLFEELTNDTLLTSDLKTFKGFDKEKGLKKLHERISGGKVRRFDLAQRDKKIWRWVAAASVLIIMGYGLWVTSRKSEAGNQKLEVAKTHDVPAPSNTRAVITLADGRKVYLDSAGNGILAQQNNVDVIRNEEGEIIYSHEGAKTQSEVVYNTLFNPRGSKVISLTLSDGTKVWLNAASSVKYPVAFVGNERKVEITGEAYFEVTHIARPFKAGDEGEPYMPFIVKKGNTEVKVLGTHFNVNAYDDEESLKVTLLEGSVQVSAKLPGLSSGVHPDEGRTVKIKPGEQAVVTLSGVEGRNSLLTTRSADLDEVMAWKNGKFVFDKTDIHTTMRQIARWYDVDVEYKDNVKGFFSGGISRLENVSQVLKMLEMTGEAHFAIEGKKVIVMK